MAKIISYKPFTVRLWVRPMDTAREAEREKMRTQGDEYHAKDSLISFQSLNRVLAPTPVVLSRVAHARLAAGSDNWNKWLKVETEYVRGAPFENGFWKYLVEFQLIDNYGSELVASPEHAPTAEDQLQEVDKHLRQHGWQIEGF